MAITIKNNTTKLIDLKNKINALPDKNGDNSSTVLEITTAFATDVLTGKTAYIADENGTPYKINGEMPNLGDSLNVEVGLNGAGQDARYGYITGVRATFAEEVYSEISNQSDLIAQIKQKLIEKGAHL